MTKPEYDPVLISIVREKTPNMMAEELCSVKAGDMDDIMEAWRTLMSGPIESEKELREQGYEPICETTRILWRKK